MYSPTEPHPSALSDKLSHKSCHLTEHNFGRGPTLMNTNTFKCILHHFLNRRACAILATIAVCCFACGEMGAADPQKRADVIAYLSTPAA